MPQPQSSIGARSGGVMSMIPSETRLSPLPTQILELSALASETNLELLFGAATKAIVSRLKVDRCHIHRFSASEGPETRATSSAISHDTTTGGLSVLIEGET